MFWLLEKILRIKIAFAQTGGIGGDRGIIIDNPLDPLGTGNVTITTLLERIVKFLVIVGAPIMIIMVLYAAFLMVTAAGDEEKFKKGRNVLLYAVIGYVILLSAYGIIDLIEVILKGEELNIE